MNTSLASPTKILFVGEAWGANEAWMSKVYRRPCPFVGKSGFFLYCSLFQAGIISSVPPKYYPGAEIMVRLWKALEPEILITNVFQERPAENSNDVDAFFCSRRDPEAFQDLAPKGRSQFVKESFSHHLFRLFAEISQASPNLIVGLGETAAWAILQDHALRATRGTINIINLASQRIKFLPTYHPAAVLRRNSLQPEFLAFLIKAKHESFSPSFSQKVREIWCKPDLSDINRWWIEHGMSSSLIGIDIETVGNEFIGEVGFASSSSCAIHIPFFIKESRNSYFNYWPSPEKEYQAWLLVKEICESNIPKIGQNLLYDIQYLLWKAHIRVRNFIHDTMLEHHAIYPGLGKSLGLLGSLYTNEVSWKTIRSFSSDKED